MLQRGPEGRLERDEVGNNFTYCSVTDAVGLIVVVTLTQKCERLALATTVVDIGLGEDDKANCATAHHTARVDFHSSLTRRLNWGAAVIWVEAVKKTAR